MKFVALIPSRLGWLNLPGAVLIALLQRTPVVRVAATAEQLVASAPLGEVLRSAAAVAASLGAIHSMAGATTLSTNSHPSPLSATVGTAITSVLFTVQGAQGAPASWTIGGSIPPGVTFSGRSTAGIVNIANGFYLTLAGTPTTAGNYSVTLRAWEGSNGTQNGSPTFTYVINVAAAATTAPSFTSNPSSQTVTAGSSVTFSATAGGSPTPTYQWNFNGAAISGATSSSYTISSAASANAGSYTVTATNSAGSATSSAATLTVNAATTAPSFTANPSSQTVTAGSSVTFSATAGGSPAPTYQWNFNGAAISGATSSTYTISSAQSGNSGSYTVTATNSAGSATSSAATLSVNAASSGGAITSALSNLSVRTTMAAGQTLIVGAVVSGGAKTVLVRAGGPALNQFGLQGMVDPRLEIYSGVGALLANNDDWPVSLSTTFASVGAFGYATGSKDAAITQSLNGSFTAQAKGTGEGVVLVEMYDVTGGTSARLINGSARNIVGTGDNILIAGFNISGSGTKRLLIRGIGPGLAQFGVSGTLADPLLKVYDSNNVLIASNDTWDPSLASTFASLGAFGLPAGSKDAALLVTLAAGASYTAQVSGADGGTGDGIVEIYEVP